MTLLRALRHVAAAVLSLLGVAALQRAPDHAWGSVTVDGQRYKLSAAHVYAIVPEGAPPPAFTGCRWTAPASKEEICHPAKGGTPAVWAIGFTPYLIQAAMAFGILAAVLLVASIFVARLTTFARRMAGCMLAFAIVAMVLPFITVTHAASALHTGSVFFGALGTNYMLLAIVTSAVALRVSRARQDQMARSTAAVVAAA